MLSAAVPGPPATRPALAALQAKERAETIAGLVDRPLLPPWPVADVARIGRDGDHLSVTSRLGPTPGQCRIDVTDIGGVCDVNRTALRRPGLPPPPAAGPADATVPDAFLFDWYQFDQPGCTVVGTTVAVLPANVQIARTTETPDGGGTQLQLTEQRFPPVDGGAPGISLKVTVTGPAADDATSQPAVEVTAASFADLARRYPAEVGRYLEPVLRGLHAEAVLPPETTLAYQVFAADVTVDPAAADRVRGLVARLDADDFHDRDAAVEALRAMGPVAAVAVARLDPARLSPEQRARTAAVVRRFRPVSDADAGRLADDADFLVNCLDDPDPFVVRTAMARLGRLTGRPIPFDPALTGQARRDAVRQLRQAIDRGRPATPPSR